MAKNEPKTPDDVKTTPANEIPAEEQAAPAEQLEAGGEAPAPEMTAEEAVILAHEGNEALRDIGEEQLEPPAPFDIPDPNNVVVSFEKINELANERKAAGPEDKTPEPEKATRRGKRPKVEKADKPEKEPKPEKAPKDAAENKEAPAPEPEQPPEPKEAPRSGEQEQIVYINLSELFPFKDHPFQVRKDEEMAAMVESVKDKGVTQAAIVRPREDGGYEMISGHRRQMATRF